MSVSRLTILLAAGLALSTGSLSAQGLANRRAPSFSLPDSSLQQHDILDYRGSWLFIDFMKTDCPVCKQLSIKLEGLKKKYGNKVGVLSIVITPPETQVSVGKYIAETKTTTPIVFDSSQVAIGYFKATPQNPAFETPHLFAINPAGMIVKDWGQAGVESPALLGELDQLIAGSAAKK
ncbi:MAG: redoxin domain-containing protein [Acidobacteriia bacterium]|nr:redoxin domain-containing protein [Terriglobia bacterium]